MKRPTKIEYYLDMADQVSTRSTCLTSKYGCVIVNNDKVVSTGYNGAPRGAKNCIDTGLCIRDCEGLRRYNECRAVHAEANAMLHANYTDLINSTMYISRSAVGDRSSTRVEPCESCKRLIVNGQVSKVICRQLDGSVLVFNPPIWSGVEKNDN